MKPIAGGSAPARSPTREITTMATTPRDLNTSPRDIHQQLPLADKLDHVSQRASNHVTTHSGEVITLARFWTNVAIYIRSGRELNETFAEEVGTRSRWFVV